MLTVECQRVADQEDNAGACFFRKLRGKLLALVFVGGEADFHQAVIGQRLVEGGQERVGDAVEPDMDGRFESLRAGFEFADRGRFQLEKAISE